MGSTVLQHIQGYQSSRHTVISSHGHVVTWSTRHTRVSSQSQLVTSEHIINPPVVIFLSARRSGSTQKQCSTRTAYTCSKRAISKSLMTAKLLNVTNA